MPRSHDSRLAKVRVYKAHGPTDGHMVRDLLQAAGIPVELRGAQLATLAGGIPIPDTWPSLWVVKHNEARAKAIIADFEAGGGTDWTCACGEENTASFGSCWSCGRDRPDLFDQLR